MDFKVKVLVVEDEQFARSLLSNALNGAGFEVTETDSASQAVKKAKNFDPDVAVVDVDLGQGPSGVDVAYRLRMHNPTVGILFLTNVGNNYFQSLLRSFDNGPFGHLSKDRVSNLKDLTGAVYQASRGTYDSTSVSDNDPQKLTRIQREVMQGLYEGKSIQQIADVRSTSVRAVNRIIQRACENLGVDEATGYQRVIAALRVFRG